jgi:biotin carboxyl carrier protein
MSEYVVSVNDKKLKVMLQNESQVSVDTREYNYNLVHLYGNKYLLKLNDKFIELYSEISKDGSYLVSVKGNVYETIIHSSLQEKAAVLLRQKSEVPHKTEVKAPMPGMILKIKKNLNDKIAQGETVLILEAMKMENDLRAPHSGIIKDIFVKEGIAIEKGTVLFTIE